MGLHTVVTYDNVNTKANNWGKVKLDDVHGLALPLGCVGKTGRAEDHNHVTTGVPLALRKREDDKQQASGSLQQQGYVYLMPRQHKMMKIRIITVGRVGDSLLSFLEVFVSAHVSFDEYTFDPGYGRCS